MIIDDFTRISLIREQWEKKYPSPRRSIMKLNMSAEDTPRQFKLPFIERRQQQNRIRSQSQKQNPIPAQSQCKPRNDTRQLRKSRQETLIMMEQMTQGFQRFKRSVSIQNSNNNQPCTLFITKDPQDNSIEHSADQQEWKGKQSYVRENVVDIPYKLQLLNKTRKQLMKEILQTNYKKKQQQVEQETQQREHFQYLKSLDASFMESKVQEYEKNKRRKEFTSRSQFTNAYYGVKALPQRSQFNVLVKHTVHLPPESRYHMV